MSICKLENARFGVQVLANFLSTPLAAGLGGDAAGWPYVAFDLDPGRVKVRPLRNLPLETCHSFHWRSLCHKGLKCYWHYHDSLGQFVLDLK